MTTTKRLYLQDKKDSMDILVKDGSVKWVSARLLQMSGFEGEELLGKSIEKVWHSILRIAVPYPDLKGVLHIEGCFFFSKTYEVYFSKLRLEQNADENGSTSITFIKSFRFFEKKFPTAQVMLGEKNLAVAVFANENHILLGANSGFLDLMEEPRNQLENAAGVRAEEVFGGPNCNMGISMLTTVSKTMRPCILKDLKWSNKCRDTMFINVIIIPVLDEKKVSLLLFMMEDVTIKMLSSNQIARQVKIIQQQKENLETTIENMSDGFCIADPQGNILYMNGQMRSYLNVQGNIRSLRDLMEINTFTTKEGNRIEKLELSEFSIFQGIPLRNKTVWIRHRDREVALDMNASPVFNHDGEVALVLFNGHDVTLNMEHERIISKQKEELSKIIEMKDEFLSMISHEFKTPITVITSAIQAMEFICKDTLPDKAKWFTDKIKQNAYRQLRLVNNLLDYTRVNAGHFQIRKSNVDIVFLSRSIIDSVRIYADQKGVKLLFRSTCKVKIMGMDEEKYERILLNLLSNAIKFTPVNKRIFVRIGMASGKIKISVRDEGIGIPEDKLEMVFERFVQVDNSLARSTEGTGLGLSLVKMLVEKLEGSISVSSKMGQGSTFSLLFPDEKMEEGAGGSASKDVIDDRLVHATEVEFSDIYLS